MSNSARRAAQRRRPHVVDRIPASAGETKLHDHIALNGRRWGSGSCAESCARLVQPGGSSVRLLGNVFAVLRHALRVWIVMLDIGEILLRRLLKQPWHRMHALEGGHFSTVGGVLLGASACRVFPSIAKQRPLPGKVFPASLACKQPAPAQHMSTWRPGAEKRRGDHRAPIEEARAAAIRGRLGAPSMPTLSDDWGDCDASSSVCTLPTLLSGTCGLGHGMSVSNNTKHMQLFVIKRVLTAVRGRWNILLPRPISGACIGNSWQRTATVTRNLPQHQWGPQAQNGIQG